MALDWVRKPKGSRVRTYEPEPPSQKAYDDALAMVEAMRKDRDRWSDEAAMKAREVLSLRVERDRAWADVEAAQRKVAALEARADRLEALEVMVRDILNQADDDHCHLDWGRLYPEMARLVGMPDWKPSVLPEEAMLRNCEHFVKCLGSGASYEAPVITEREAQALRAEAHRLAIENAELRDEADRLAGRRRPDRSADCSWSGLVEGS